MISQSNWRARCRYPGLIVVDGDAFSEPDQDLRCLARYASSLNTVRGHAVVGEDGTVRLVDYPVRQAWVLPERGGD